MQRERERVELAYITMPLGPFVGWLVEVLQLLSNGLLSLYQCDSFTDANKDVFPSHLEGAIRYYTVASKYVFLQCPCPILLEWSGLTMQLLQRIKGFDAALKQAADVERLFLRAGETIVPRSFYVPFNFAQPDEETSRSLIELAH